MTNVLLINENKNETLYAFTKEMLQFSGGDNGFACYGYLAYFYG